LWRDQKKTQDVSFIGGGYKKKPVEGGRENNRKFKICRAEIPINEVWVFQVVGRGKNEIF